MTSDQLAYEIFVVDPGSYFEARGEPASEAEHYVFHSVDLKAVERRLDGYFEPKDSRRPLHFVEVFFHRKENAYANLFAKIFLKLEQEPKRDWRAVIFFESAKLMPRFETPFEDLLEGKRIQRLCLATLPETAKTSIGLAILKLAAKPDAEVLRDATALVNRLKHEVPGEEKQAKLRDLIEFVILSKLTELSREEVKTMLGLGDYRKSRFYRETRQEALAEGKAEGKVEGKAEGKAEGKSEGKAELLHQVVTRMASKGLEAKQIADFLGVDLKAVRKILRSRST